MSEQIPGHRLATIHPAVGAMVCSAPAPAAPAPHSQLAARGCNLSACTLPIPNFCLLHLAALNHVDFQALN